MPSRFLTNYTNTTFLQYIRDDLHKCKSFSFSVSFIKKAGLVLLIRDIEAALQRGCSGRIITSTYQNFTDIESLNAFNSFMIKYPAFHCHLDYDSFHDSGYNVLGYHSKGYLFTFDDHCELIVGSSNITRYALLKNIEWDIVVSTELTSEVYRQAIIEFDDKWEHTNLLDNDIIKKYANRLNFAIECWDMDYDIVSSKIKPNYMQRSALKELNRYRTIGISRALVIAAAGSGKTFLAAFDALNFNPKRLLYIVHEGTILNKSLETFKEIFGADVNYGMLTANSKDLNSTFLFSTNLSMSNSLELFSKDEFDYIIIDECHHATADSYRKIINYFEPEFLLGLTATPERMDNQDVFDLFDKNVPYELRLRDAIINDLIVPFKYYGIRDTLINYGLPTNQERKMIAQLADSIHCDFVSEEIESHKPKGKLKALAFCRNITHARMMSEMMKDKYHTAYLSGRNNIGERIRAYNDLQDDNADLQILFTVDILNEGVDIPGVNMVLFLRPTESSTVFIQQLGRGLRKYPNKEYVTILDFIGNSYSRSGQIAFALSSLSENFVLEKRLIISMVNDNFSALGLSKYGVEINIDKLSKEEIVDKLENENFNSIAYLKQDYFNFKNYIGSAFYPKHMDYLNNDCAPDLLRFMNAKAKGRRNGSYYCFLCAIDEKDLPTFSEDQIRLINYLSEMLPLVRKYEYLYFQQIINGNKSSDDIETKLRQCIIDFQQNEFDHAIKYMIRGSFLSIENTKATLNTIIDYQFKEYVNDLLTYGLTRYDMEYGETKGFVLWHSYRIDQVQLKLCKNPGYIMKGTYIYDNAVYIFASIKKDATIAEHLNYKDKFIESNLFQWECESVQSESAREGLHKNLINSEKAYLFIRKVESENGIVLPFTYVGTGQLTNPRKTDDNNTLLFDVRMDNELPDYLQYDFGL